MDHSEGKLKNAMRRVTTILKKEEGKSDCNLTSFSKLMLFPNRIKVWLLHMLFNYRFDYTVSTSDNDVKDIKHVSFWL